MSRHSDLRELKRLTVQERSHLGLVRFRKQHMVPDVGGLGWRTKTGHLLKNQSYFPQNTRVNTWDVPACAGVNTWQDLLTCSCCQVIVAF